jgi:hypothetical protein
MVTDRHMRANGILLLYHHPLRQSAATIMEHVNAFGNHSRFPVWKLNTELGFPAGLKRLRFPVVVLHYSLWGTTGYHLDGEFLSYLDDGGACYKIAFFQDEHHYCLQRFAFINRYRIDCIYTLLEQEHVKAVYGKYTEVPRVITTIPGYVSEDLKEKAARFRLPEDDRGIDIGYRGRELQFYMGRGAREKTEISHEFARRVEGLDLQVDFDTREAGRLYGDSWYAFLGNCKAFLGVEAGVSIFDVEDVVLKEYERRIRENPGMTFAEMEEEFLGRWENIIYYRTISPRHFEAAAFLACQILFEGRYSCILYPMRHYIPLKKDYSNFDEVIAMFREKGFRREITTNAYRDLIASGEYSYERFMDGFDRELAGLQLLGDEPGDTYREVEAILQEDYLKRYVKVRSKALLYVPFPGRRSVVKWVKSAIPGLGNPRT